MAVETESLLASHNTRSEFDSDSTLSSATDVVDFDPAGDAGNPLEWSPAFKRAIVGMLAAMAFTVTFTCVGVVPVASRIVRDLDGAAASKSASVLLVTIWELGEAAGPLFIAPLSEVFGRYPVMNCANALFVFAAALAAVAQSAPLVIAARALNGLAVASNVLAPAIIGDVFVPEQRGGAMSLIMVAPLVGGAVGPAISGAVAQTMGWREVIWISVGLACYCSTLFLTCFRETYKVPILRRRAAKLRSETGNASLKTQYDVIPSGEKGSRLMWDSVMRPAVVLFGSGVLMVLALLGAVEYTYFYIMTVTLPDILEGVYGLGPAETGSCFMIFSAGSLLGVFFCQQSLDKVYIRMKEANNGVGKPEFRLPLVIGGVCSLPISVAAYGWAAHTGAPLGVFLVSLALLGITLSLSFIPITAYVVDATGIYSASALTGLIVIRCLMGTFLPLTTGPLIERLGYGWAFTVLGSITLFLAPIPTLLIRYGEKWRQRSKYTRGAMS